MKLALKDGELSVGEFTSVEAFIFRQYGFKKDRSGLTLRGKASIELLQRLDKATLLPESIQEYLRALENTRAAIERGRTSEDPQPLVNYPVKVQMFKHQIRGANMALLTFGIGGNDENSV